MRSAWVFAFLAAATGAMAAASAGSTEGVAWGVIAGMYASTAVDRYAHARWVGRMCRAVEEEAARYLAAVGEMRAQLERATEEVRSRADEAARRDGGGGE